MYITCKWEKSTESKRIFNKPEGEKKQTDLIGSRLRNEFDFLEILYLNPFCSTAKAKDCSINPALS